MVYDRLRQAVRVPSTRAYVSRVDDHDQPGPSRRELARLLRQVRALVLLVAVLSIGLYVSVIVTLARLVELTSP